MVDEEVDDALVDTFVATANKDHFLLFGESFGLGLSEASSLGAEVDDGAFIYFFNCGEAVGQRLRGHDHASAATEGDVIDFFVLVFAIFADVVDFDRDEFCFEGAFNNTFAEVGAEDFGEDCKDVESHGASLA